MGSNESKQYRQQLEDQFIALEQDIYVEQKTSSQLKIKDIIVQSTNYKLPISRIFSRNQSQILLLELGPLCSGPLSKNSTFYCNHEDVNPQQQYDLNPQYLRQSIISQHSTEHSIDIDDWSICNADFKQTDKILIL